jgi:excisionase family DNA binding protein
MVRAVPGLGAEIVLTVDGELRNTRLFRSHEQAELVGAIADTRTSSEGKGWEHRRASVENDELVDVNEGSRITGLQKPTLYRLARDGRMRTWRVLARSLRFARADLLALAVETDSALRRKAALPKTGTPSR